MRSGSGAAMSEPYTPTMGEIAEAWASRYDGEHAWAGGDERRQYEAEFDRWLAAHDREVSVRTLRDAGLSPRPFIGPTLPARIRGLYDADMRERSIRTVLNLAADLIAGYAAVIDRADRIESGADQ